MGNVFEQITVIVIVSAFLAIIFRFFRQPAILAYILTGILLGPLNILHFESREIFRSMAQIGIALLLFILGLELKLSELKSIGRSAIILGVLQVLITSVLGFLLSLTLGFTPVVSFYLGVALAFSSTIIIVKLLSDKKDLRSLYGKLSVGLLLVQDFFAIIILMLLSGFALPDNGGLSLTGIGLIIAKGVVIFSLVIFLSQSVFPKLLDFIAHSEETLFLFSLAWVFGLAAFVSSSLIGFSVEIGGFLAGIALANVRENFQIVSRVRGLRDFFITIFFVTLGIEMGFENIGSILVALIVLSAFVLLGKPFIIATITGIIGYRRRTSFLTGIHSAQISEFSLIIIFLGNRLGHVPESVVSLITGIGLVSFAVSTYMMMHANNFYRHIGRNLWFFENPKLHAEHVGVSEEDLEKLEDHVVLVGANRMGQSIVSSFKNSQDQLLVVDFDPDVIKVLKDSGVLSVFGDIADLEIQERINLSKAKLVISTVSDLDDNTHLLSGLKLLKTRAKVIVVAQDAKDAKALYKAGADYVVLPHLVGGKHLAKIIKEDNLENIEEFRKKDLPYLV